MRAIVCRPGKKAVVEDVKHSLEAMQELVGGWIEEIYPFEDAVALVCNEEGKIKGLELNRVLLDEEGIPIDVIAGTFFICGLTEESFGDIPTNLEEKYLNKFLLPEKILMSGNGRMLVIKEEGM
jgi:hypothetical protein